MSEDWIWISRWEDFQHYQPERDRAPAWIKQYTKQLDDDRYTDLSPRRRALLNDLRVAFARTSGRLRATTQVLSKRTLSRVFSSDLRALNDAGFIEFVSRPMLEERLERVYASRAPARSKDSSRRETAVKASKGPNGREATPETEEPDLPAAEDLESPRESEVQAAVASLPGSDRGTFGIVMPLAAQITTTTFREIMQTVEQRKRIKNKPGLLVNLLQIAVYDQRVADSLNAADQLEPSATEKARRDPEHYISVMAPHLTEHDLRKYLVQYVKDATTHEALVALWQDARAKVPA